MPCSYLIYQLTPPELPVAICFTVVEVSAFLGVSRQSVWRIVKGLEHHPLYGIFKDEFDPITLESIKEL